jgi:hypothetical protein
MGLITTNNGVSVQFCNKDGSPDGAPLYGRYTAFFGLPREKVLGAPGAPAETRDERDFKGSDDWLTLIAVADTQEKLDQIIHENPDAPRTPANTSASSRRAQIELHIGGVRKTFKDRITISSGPILQFKRIPKFHVAHVKVLPEGTALRDLQRDHPFVAEFQGSSPLLE